ncbi:hypothetical protein F5878DRAFT_648192 [Lentinula raphanica]|uniref:Uncharacterized protein n=1 Tax=Lentinula raphanica TaxID=153919 RepID=A0AA38NUL2_9AGAR|nr:hypothetical protein F5878DRAFT_648192 [Lentinula raphanica]
MSSRHHLLQHVCALKGAFLNEWIVMNNEARGEEEVQDKEKGKKDRTRRRRKDHHKAGCRINASRYTDVHARSSIFSPKFEMKDLRIDNNEERLAQQRMLGAQAKPKRRRNSFNVAKALTKIHCDIGKLATKLNRNNG